MSANLNEMNGKVSVMTATDKHGLPWHKLGQMVGSAQTWEDTMKLAQLDWSVQKEQLTNPLTNKIMPAWAIFRSDNKDFLGTVGEQYMPIQNIKMGEHIDHLIKDINGAHYESAGVLGIGERVWAMARIPVDIQIKGTNDISKSFLLCTTSHDGSMAYTLKLVSVRVVCNNTLTQALSEKYQTVRVKHTANAINRIDGKVKQANSFLGLIEDMNQKMNELALRKMTKESNQKIMDAMFGNDWRDSTRKRDQVEQIAQLFSQNDHNAIPQIKGTAYNLLNAFTEYEDHYRSVRQTEGKMLMTKEQIRTEGALWGTGEQEKSDALRYILENTEHNPRREEPITVGTSSKGLDFILNNVQV